MIAWLEYQQERGEKKEMEKKMRKTRMHSQSNRILRWYREEIRENNRRIITNVKK